MHTNTMIAVFLELTPSRVLDTHPERCYLSTTLNVVTKQKAVIRLRISRCVQSRDPLYKQTAVSGRQILRLIRHTE
jgi:hypothetical protein